MFKVLRYNIFESNRANEILLPSQYPNKNLIEKWIKENENEILNKEITFMYKDWDFKTNDYEINQKTSKIIDLYQDDGYLCLVTKDNVPHVVYSNTIIINKEGKRKITKEDPLGEEIWEEEEEINEARAWQMRVGDYVLCQGNFRGVIGAKDKYAKIIGNKYERKNGKHIDFYTLEFETPLIDKRSGEEIRTNRIEISSYQIKNLLRFNGIDYERKKAGFILPYEASNTFTNIIRNIKFSVPYKTYNMTYFDAEKDAISYIPANRIENLEKSGEDPYKSKYRQSAKVNKILKVLNDRISDPEIEIYGNKFKAIYNLLNEDIGEDRLKIVNGKEITYWYHCDRYAIGGGSLNSSCMRHERVQERVKFYSKYPDKIALCILLDDKKEKLLARALIWKLDEPKGVIFMDRIYYVSPIHEIILSEYAKKHNMKSKSSGFGTNSIDGEILLVKLPVSIYENIPYLDTLRYKGRGNSGIGYFSNLAMNVLI